MKISYGDAKYLRELSKNYPTRNAVLSEVIKLNSILDMPKGTEHFLSDIHGEYEAFLHIRKNASGVIRNKVERIFGGVMSAEKRAELATLIYYPREKMDELREKNGNVEAKEYISIMQNMIAVFSEVCRKYTRERIRECLEKSADGFEFIIEELISCGTFGERENYNGKILSTVVKIGAAEDFIRAIASAIKNLVIDHLHIVGDIFDRGPRADIIIDELMEEASIDIQWGNHDALWLGAASGSRTCIATVLNNSITYKNLDVIEIGYGISLRPLALFAAEVYAGSELDGFMPKGEGRGNFLLQDDDYLIARMHKAISIIQFKLEGQTILRNPHFNMGERLLLDKINREKSTVIIEGVEYSMRTTDFPTVNELSPYELTAREEELMKYLKNAFMRSEKLCRHAKFLYEKGESYTVYNRNLLFHGCIPLDKNGDFMPLEAAHGKKGRELMDYCNQMARAGYFAKEGSRERQNGKDFLWFLWCGKDSPLCARKKITTFERLFIEDSRAWIEPKNDYYMVWNDEKIAERILLEFSLGGKGSYIINGHVPVIKGENPVKANGRLIVIDGGFCKAYQSATGIGGYTLIYNAEGIRISAHESFSGKENAIKNNADIISDSVVFKPSSSLIKVKNTDTGATIREKICDLMLLLAAYERGVIKECNKPQ